MFIRADCREPDKILETLRTKYGLEVRVEKLEIGDYLFSDVCVERKSVSDFLRSLSTGRLWEQVLRMKEAYSRPILILEGPHILAYNKESRMAEKRLLGGLSSVALSWSLPVLPSLNHEQTSYLLATLFTKASKKSGEYLKPVPKKARSLEEVKSDILCCIPGIGRKTAGALLERVESLHVLADMGPEELASNIPGLGLKRAKKTHEAFNL